MGNWIALAGAAVAIIGPVCALAYRNPAKWPHFRDAIGVICGAIAGLFGSMGIGAALASSSTFAKYAPDLVAGCGLLFGLAVATAALVWIADWLRDESR